MVDAAPEVETEITGVAGAPAAVKYCSAMSLVAAVLFCVAPIRFLQ